MRGEPDDTVRLNRPRTAPRPPRPVVLSAAVLVVLAGLAGAGAWWSMRPVAVPTAPAPALAPAPAPPPFAPPLATEAQILADAPEALAVYRYTSEPDVVVLQFPSLAEQGRMLNRVAALIEKAGFPHDRVLPTDELNAKIVASGDTPATFYYGHDYRAADLLRFLGLAAGSSMTEEEHRLQSLVALLGWRDASARGALISLVRQSDGDGIDASARATILRHELSHGLYFTDPAYADFVRRFWTETMSPRDRAQFTAFLVKDGYDPAIEDLIINETQAYLMYTADKRFFSAADLGMPEARLDTLRRQFLASMPPSWLRDLTTVPPSLPLIPVKAPRRYGPLLVRRTRVDTARRAPRRLAASRAARSSRT